MPCLTCSSVLAISACSSCLCSGVWLASGTATETATKRHAQTNAATVSFIVVTSWTSLMTNMNREGNGTVRSLVNSKQENRLRRGIGERKGSRIVAMNHMHEWMKNRFCSLHHKKHERVKFRNKPFKQAHLARSTNKWVEWASDARCWDAQFTTHN